MQCLDKSCQSRLFDLAFCKVAWLDLVRISPPRQRVRINRTTAGPKAFRCLATFREPGSRCLRCCGWRCSPPCCAQDVPSKSTGNCGASADFAVLCCFTFNFSVHSACAQRTHSRSPSPARSGCGFSKWLCICNFQANGQGSLSKFDNFRFAHVLPFSVHPSVIFV